MNNEVAAFLAFLKDERQLSDNTLMSYQRDLEQTVTYLEDRGIADWQQVDHYLLIDLLNSFRQQGKANSTINRVISSLRQFYKYMIRHHNLTINPMEMIDHQYTFNQPPAPVILTEKEIEQLLAVPDVSTPIGLRDRALLEIMDATGMRVSEVIALDRTALHLDVKLLQLTGKNERERMIPLSQPAVKWLTDYLDRGRPRLLRDEHETRVFLNAHGYPLTRQGIWKKMKEWVSEAKIKKEVTPQTMRYSFAVHLIENGADVQLIQEILGYNAMKALQPYLQVSPQQLSANYMKYHPRA
ncbi:tyrosine-type recombinase/integrase [Limosilactobacillus reuteri]|uniref:tyrosine-type recombinase/integrase n=1 Tax=Limosilactobacillus reuteri TaxID=1598 RepID=UPI001E299791|nr:tyrosine-type recombinase/integrase [Limosilactobacillus reuteri]MCC4436045.1 tyrosine-type recombinase/integrase [Limosilactobacillus reuteri]MCC4438428.1 tyrosine-type recombinase/integrase [Limosilactobacillus reuteri]MCC4442082.1 tyrosine-type recombinase/integrase [Limosilactobacillus reuteri]MCC4444022.1 tyrosine-type recombinase/integrase [Limosilactobacillus reuteri]MCC4446119.1 tyrosine-type recombinase/integrase [Limosilactobacillus reuteri]